VDSRGAWVTTSEVKDWDSYLKDALRVLAQVMCRARDGKDYFDCLCREVDPELLESQLVAEVLIEDIRRLQSWHTDAFNRAVDVGMCIVGVRRGLREFSPLGTGMRRWGRGPARTRRIRPHLH